MTDSIHISLEDLTLYAMQALSSAERVPIRLHLAECEACRTELAAVSGDLALMAMSTEQHPLPEGARDRFLTRIGAAPTQANKIVEIDARPSDCLALATAQKRPIYVSASLFEQVEDMTEVLDRINENENGGELE